MYLVKFQADYAGEFDVYGFKVFPDIKSAERIFKIAELFWVQYPGKLVEFGFGREGWLEARSYKEYRNMFEVIEISEQEAKVLNKLFGNDWDEYADYGLTQIFKFEDGLDISDWPENLQKELAE